MAFSEIWFYSLVLSVITAIVVESLPERKAD
jgi:hypothetical protein